MDKTTRPGSASYQSIFPYSEIKNFFHDFKGSNFPITYYSRSSGKKSKTTGSNISKQKKVLKEFSRINNLPAPDKKNQLIEYESGIVSLIRRAIGKKKSNSNFCVSNFDRLGKYPSLKRVEVNRNFVIRKQHRIFIPDREYNFFGDLHNKIMAGDECTGIYTKFISNRMVESIEAKSYRKDLEPICNRYIRNLKADLENARDLDSAIWVIGSYSGALVNEYKKHFKPIDESRLCQYDLKPAMTVGTIDHLHPEYLLAKNKNELVIRDAQKYGVFLSSARVTQIRDTISYDLIRDYFNKDFGQEVFDAYHQIKTVPDKTSFEGLSAKQRRSIKNHFPKYKGLRSFQRKAIHCLQSEDYFIVQVMAGAGKSFVFQYPAALGKQILVISPLCDLIKNQVKQASKILGKKKVGFLSSDQSDQDNREDVRRFQKGEIKLLISTPNQLDSSKEKKLKDHLSTIEDSVDLFVVDEAHHPALDGEKFRIEYHWKALNKLWNYLGNPQSVFLSASLSKESKEAINKIVGRKSLKIIKGPLIRRNVALLKIDFDGEYAQEKKMAWVCLTVKYMKEVLKFKKVIVYVNSPARVYLMMKQIKNCLDGNAKVYGIHSKRGDRGKDKSDDDYTFIKDRKGGSMIVKISKKKNPKVDSVQELFEEGKGGVLVATSKYAEGIDVDVQGVIVADRPVNIETLYQEVLRAGHQGQKAISIICDDDRSANFVCRSLLHNDPKLKKQHNKDFKFLLEDVQGLALWNKLIKKFK
jgi:superfamily II DNA helicase RecQ